MHRNIIFIVKPTRCTNVSNLFYFVITLHVSDGLSVHHQELLSVHTATGICQTDTAVCLLAYIRQILLTLCLQADSSICLTNACCCMYSLYFGKTLYMFRTVFPSIIRSTRLYIQQPNRYCCLLASKHTAVSV